MPFQVYNTGAVGLWVSTGDGFNPELLGFGETAPDMQVESPHGSFKCDLSGNKIAYDFSWAGSFGVVSVILTNWNEKVARSLSVVPGPHGTGSIGNAGGIWKLSDYGSLIGYEEWSFTVWLEYNFGAGVQEKGVYTRGKLVNGVQTPGGMPDGYRFPRCKLQGPWSVQTGTRPMKKQFIFYAWPDGPLTQSDGVQSGADIFSNNQNPSYILFDNNMRDIESLSF